MGFRIEVTAQLLDGEGEPIFGYSTARVLPLVEDPQQNLLDGVAGLIADMGEAAQDIRDQAARELPALAQQMAELERQERRKR